ncbi:MAG: ABC transporter permease [Candidatus Methanodesulfokora washburnensis]|jgi:ABC-2 type transport system permease protein
MNERNIVYAMLYRQLRRYFRARSRVLGTIINPLMFFLFLGMGFSASMRGMSAVIGIDYLAFLAPGIAVMTAFSSSFIGGISVIWDKEFGFLKEVLVAPASRTYAILGRALGDSITSVIQSFLIVILMYAIVPSLKVEGLLFALGSCFITSLMFNSLGIAIASKIRSPEGFQLIANILIFPLIFLSGAFYPINNLPAVVKPIFYINPLTYSVDLTRYFMTGISSLPIYVSLSVLLLLTAVFTFLSARVFNKSTLD